MLKSIVFIEEHTDISKYSKLRAFLKRKCDDYKPKEYNVFSREEVNKFLAKAPDNIFLFHPAIETYCFLLGYGARKHLITRLTLFSIAT